MTKRRSRQFWHGTVAEYERSSSDARAFASGRGLNVNTLKWWVGVFRKEARKRSEACASGFVEVAAARLPVVVGETAARRSRDAGVTVRVGAGVVLVLHELPPAEYVAAVARCYDAVAS